jgi:hypothetical protein
MEPEYFVIKSGNAILLIERRTWELEVFRKLIGGKKIGEGMTLEEATAIKQLMESAS